MNIIYHNQYKKENHRKLFQIQYLQLWNFSNEFKTAVVNEPSVFELIKVYCMKN